MPSMTMISVTAVPDWLRGTLTRWLLEVGPGLYLGSVSARVRDQLWTAICAYPDDNEQGFTMHTAGTRRRRPIDFDGLTLITFQATEPPSESEPAVTPDD